MNEDSTKYFRANILFASAYVTILLCLVATVWFSEMGEYAQGVVTLVIGRFLGYTDAVYSFEYGTTRTSKTKDDTISKLTANQLPTAPTEVGSDVKPKIEIEAEVNEGDKPV